MAYFWKILAAIPIWHSSSGNILNSPPAKESSAILVHLRGGSLQCDAVFSRRVVVTGRSSHLPWEKLVDIFLN